MDTHPPKRLREKDCIIDWKNHPAQDENGNPTIEDWTEFRELWILEDCECSAFALANRERCFRYYTFDYDMNLFHKYMHQEGYTEATVAYWGLEKMFDDGWIKSPAFVDWKNMLFIYRMDEIINFVRLIYEPDMRVRIIKYFIDNADFLYGPKEKKQYIPELKNLLINLSEAARIHREELKKQTTIDITQQQQLDLVKENAILKQRLQKLEQRLQKLERQPRKLEQHFHESVGVAANNTNNLEVHNQ